MASGDTLPTTARRSDTLAFLRRRAERYERRKAAPPALPIFIPDALGDTRYERKRRALKMFKHGEGLACRLLSATGHRLQFVTVPLGPGTPADLYSHATNARARALTRAIVGKAAVWATLELGLDGGLHLHLLVAADAALLLPRGSNPQPVKPTDADYRRVLGYMCKPSDARACMVKLGPRRYGKPVPELLGQAIVDYEQARARGRLPRLSWTYNVPRLKPDALERPA